MKKRHTPYILKSLISYWSALQEAVLRALTGLLLTVRSGSEFPRQCYLKPGQIVGSVRTQEEIALYKKANRLFITDTIARQTLIDQGFNPLAIIVTGNPVNDEIVRIARSREAYRKEIRDQYRIPLDATLILFVTTNDLDIEANSSPEHPEWLGIKEEDVI